jgi:hypothetical protein
MENIEMSDIIQSPTASIVIPENGESVLVLSDWNVEGELDGYTKDEVKSLINILMESWELMDKYNKANEGLPLFEPTESSNDVTKQNSALG